MEDLLLRMSLGANMLQTFSPEQTSRKSWDHERVRIPEIAFCEIKEKLVQEFLALVHDVMSLSTQQTQAVINSDPDFVRFDLLIHLATERKENAKYALIQHMESHHCEEG